MARLRELARDYPCIGEVRGKGLMIGMELIEPMARAHPGARAVRRRGHPRLPQRPAAALLRREHGALHAAAERERGGGRRSDGLAARPASIEALARSHVTPCGQPTLAYRLALLRCAAGAAQAAREPVLKQIDLPHNYYWRELYLPQLTTGPSRPSFMPDGNDAGLQHGRLAVAAAHRRRRSHRTDPRRRRLRLPARRRARRSQASCSRATTATPSSCGGSIWPAAREQALTSGGAVNVEPRLSPDGTTARCGYRRRAPVTSTCSSPTSTASGLRHARPLARRTQEQDRSLLLLGVRPRDQSVLVARWRDDLLRRQSRRSPGAPAICGRCRSAIRRSAPKSSAKKPAGARGRSSRRTASACCSAAITAASGSSCG